MRIHGGAGAGVRRSAGKIPAVWSGSSALRPCGLAIRRCGQTFVGVNPADTPSAGAPLAAVPSGGLPGGCSVRRSRPAAMGGDSALRPDVCRCEPGGHAVGRRPWRPFRLGGCPAAVQSGGPARRPWVAVLPCGQTFVGVNPADTPSAGAPGGRPAWGAARRLFVRRRQRAPIQSAWRASRRKTGMVASGAAAVTVRPPGWTAPVCSSVQSAPAGR